MKSQPIRVGFDLDGVILYNPVRLARPLIVLAKKILGKDLRKFHYPRSKIQRFIWTLLHKSSLWIAPGFEDVKRLVQQKKIIAYIVTARYEFLKDDFQKWLDRIEAKKYFTGCYFNNDDEQPYLFKADEIKRLDLDYFLEDNWDIVQFINKIQETRGKKSGGAKIFWITNVFDRNVPYPYKFLRLKDAVKQIESELS